MLWKRQLALVGISISLGLVSYWLAREPGRKVTEETGKVESHDEQTQSERKILEGFATALSGQASSELNRLEKVLNDVSEIRLKPYIQEHPHSKSAKNQEKAKMFKKLNAAAAQSGILFQVSGDMFDDEKGNPVAKMMATELEMERDVLEVSLWVRSKEDSPPQRLISGVNKDQVTAAEAAAFRAHSKEAEDEAVMKKAFEGQPYLRMNGKAGEKRTVWVVLPVGSNAAVEEVISANIDAKYFGKLFSWDLADRTQAALLSGEGSVLASFSDSDDGFRQPQEILRRLEKARKQAVRKSGSHSSFSTSMNEGNAAVLVAAASVSENGWARKLGMNVLLMVPDPGASPAQVSTPSSSSRNPFYFAFLTSIACILGFFLSGFFFADVSWKDEATLEFRPSARVTAKEARVEPQPPVSRILPERPRIASEQTVREAPVQVAPVAPVQAEPVVPVQVEPVAMVQSEPEANVQEEPMPEVQAEAKIEIQPEPQVEVQVEAQVEAQTETHVEVQAEPQVEIQPDIKEEAQAEPQAEVQAEVQPEPQPVVSIAPEVENKKDSFWYIHDGAKNVGPLTVEEVAQRLFVQEIDFDCECWQEGDGLRRPISASAIFQDPSHAEFNQEGDGGGKFWIYDGTGIRGPFSRDALLLAIERRVIPNVGLICEDTTVSGWKPLHVWLGAQAPTDQVA